MPTVVELREEIIAKQKAIADMFAAKPDKDFTEEEVSQLRQKNAELNDLAEKLAKLEEIEGIERRVKGAMPFPRKEQAPEAPVRKTLGQLFVESKAFKEYSPSQKRGPSVEIDLFEIVGSEARNGIKAVLTTTGYPPEATRIPGLLIVPGEQQPTIADLLPSARTTQNAIVYMEETTAVNAAAETAEGGEKPESELAFTERTSNVRKIATILPVTEELLQDAPAIEDYVNNRLSQFITYREDTQLLNGDGNPPNLRGILNTPGIQTQAKGADSVPDAILKAMTKVATGAFLPVDTIVMNPLAWQNIRLLKATDGTYLWGPPSESGPARIWGINVTTTTVIAATTALVGSFRQGAQLFRRTDISLGVSDSHADYFAKNLLAIRAEERLALVVFRPAAFCTVTGI